MISQQILNEIRADFYLGADQERLPIPQHRADEFWQWFGLNAITFEQYNGNVDALINQDYQIGNCFGNAQNEARLNDRSYCEGFAKIQGRYIYHGFNYAGAQAIDVTVINNPGDFADHNGNLPAFYFGIPIGLATINDINEHWFAINLNAVLPLLIIHFIAQAANL